MATVVAMLSVTGFHILETFPPLTAQKLCGRHQLFRALRYLHTICVCITLASTTRKSAHLMPLIFSQV